MKKDISLPKVIGQLKRRAKTQAQLDDRASCVNLGVWMN